MSDNDPGHTPPSMVRPYSLTSGRTRPTVDLAWEALVTRGAFPSERHRALNAVEKTIIDMASDMPSIAEIATKIGVPIGVARVLVADLVSSGHVRVSATLDETSATGERRDLIERILVGLRGI